MTDQERHGHPQVIPVGTVHETETVVEIRPTPGIALALASPPRVTITVAPSESIVIDSFPSGGPGSLVTSMWEYRSGHPADWDGDFDE